MVTGSLITYALLKDLSKTKCMRPEFENCPCHFQCIHHLGPGCTFNFQFLKLFICVCSHPHVCRCSWMPTEGIHTSWSWSYHCEPPDMGVKSQTLVLCKSNKHPQPLNHLCSFLVTHVWGPKYGTGSS